MNVENALCLDRESLNTLFSTLTKLITDKDEAIVQEIEKILNQIFELGRIDKQRLITRWIQVVGKDTFELCKSTNFSDFLEKLKVIIKDANEYLKSTGDCTYLLAAVSIAIDWYLYQSIDLGDN